MKIESTNWNPVLIIVIVAIIAAFTLDAVFSEEDLRRERIHAVLMEEAPSMAATMRVVDQIGSITVIELTDLSYNTCRMNVTWTDKTMTTVEDIAQPHGCRNETQ